MTVPVPAPPGGPALAGACLQLPACTPEALALAGQLEARLKQHEQVYLDTHHVLHGGLYVRTIVVPAGVCLTGAQMKVPTCLVVSGDAELLVGEESVRVTGYAVLPGAAGRKQVFLAHADTTLTMAFATTARTVEAAEAEFTDDADALMSRAPGARNFFNVTGD